MTYCSLYFHCGTTIGYSSGASYIIGEQWRQSGGGRAAYSGPQSGTQLYTTCRYISRISGPNPSYYCTCVSAMPEANPSALPTSATLERFHVIATIALVCAASSLSARVSAPNQDSQRSADMAARDDGDVRHDQRRLRTTAVRCAGVGYQSAPRRASQRG